MSDNAKPVAWACKGDAEDVAVYGKPYSMLTSNEKIAQSWGDDAVPLYAHPPAPVPPVVAEDDAKLLRSVCEYVADERLLDLYQSGLLRIMSDQEEFCESVRSLPDRILTAALRVAPVPPVVAVTDEQCDELRDYLAMRYEQYNRDRMSHGQYVDWCRTAIRAALTAALRPERGEDAAGLLHDNVHKDVGVCRAAKTTRTTPQPPEAGR